MTLEITEQNYEELKGQGKPMVIDFSAAWCGPCKKIGPVVDALAEKYDGQVIVGKCDVDDNADLCAQFGVRNIPYIVFLNASGEQQDKCVGAVSAADIEAKIQALL